MAEVTLKHIKKVYPNTEKKSKKGQKKSNLMVTDEGVLAVQDFNLDIKDREFIVLVGPSGCGKSTLIKILNGIIFPMEGSYTYENHEITEKALKDSRFAKWFHQQMGYVFQNADTQLFCGSVEEEIAFGPIQMGLSEEAMLKRILQEWEKWNEHGTT